MAWYDENQNWVVGAVNDALKLVASDNMEILDMQKTASDITINPLMLLGGIAGTALAGGAIASQKEQEYKKMYGNAVAKILNDANKKVSDLGSDYYSDIANIDRDLKIMFTPFSVVYMLRGTVVDTVSTDTMTSTMRAAWKDKNSDYFKTVLLNKVRMEAQQSEQMFIKRLIDYDASLKNNIKNASTDFEEVEYGEHSVIEVLDKLAVFRRIIDASTDSAVIDKYAAALLEYMADSEPDNIPLELGAAKMAGENDLDLGLTKLSFLCFGKNEDKNTLTVEDMKKDLSISYLPDRILFISNGIVVSQMNTFEMNEEGYAHFKRKDNDFFRKLFFNMAKHAGYDFGDVEKLGLDESDEPVEFTIEAGILDDTERTAAYALEPNDILEELFTSDTVHPKVYYLYMMKQFGERWLEWDMETLENMLHDTLGITAFGEIAMNKLMCISLLFNSDSAYTGYHTFEKVARTFNNKSIDFEMRESNLSLGEIVNAIRIMGDIISDTDDNIYDNFSDHAFSYMVEVMAAQNYRVCTHQTDSKNETAFWKLFNFELLEFWNKTLPNGLFAKRGKGNSENSLIQKLVVEITDQFRGDIDIAKIRAAVKEKCTEAGLGKTAYIEIVSSNVLNGLAVDKFILYINESRDEQIKKYIA